MIWRKNSKIIELNPEKLFGGKWQKIEGKFLFAADDKRKVDSTGGKEKVTLTIEEMPSHDHEPLEGGLFAKGGICQHIVVPRSGVGKK